MDVSSIKLSTRIYFQQIMVVLALIGLGVYSLSNLQRINEFAVELADDDFPVLSLNMHVGEAVHDQEYQILTYRYLALLHVLASEGDKKAKMRDFEEGRASYLNSDDETEKAIGELEAQLTTQLADERDAEMIAMLKEMKAQIVVVKAGHDKLRKIVTEIDKLMADGDDAGLNRLLADIFATYKALDQDLGKLLDMSRSDILRSIEHSKQISLDLVDMLYIIVISVSFVAIVLTVITTFSLRTLRRSVEIISGSVQQVATAAAQSGNAISLVSDGAKRQSDSISQAVTAVEQSASVLNEVSKSAEEATELAKNAAVLVRGGKEKMDAMVRVVSRIEENGNKINKITEIIGGIASQTNMLALNAAIEAARAGEQGKGFAVVADQVKSLAESSKSSVDDIVTLIEQAKVDAIEAVQVASTVNNEMEKIFESARNTERMMQNISTAMEEQVSTTEELSQNMDTLRDIGNGNANAAEEITETIIELSRIASDTNQEIKKFNI